jgi:hypothetical protein
MVTTTATLAFSSSTSRQRQEGAHAVWEFRRGNDDFEIDQDMENKLLITVSQDGYLKRAKEHSSVGKQNKGLMEPNP